MYVGYNQFACYINDTIPIPSGVGSYMLLVLLLFVVFLYINVCT